MTLQQTIEALLPDDLASIGNRRLIHVDTVRRIVILLARRIEALEEQVAELKKDSEREVGSSFSATNRDALNQVVRLIRGLEPPS